MKKLILLPYTALFLVFILGSCSIDKRLYRDGYHVEWNQKKSEILKNNPSDKMTDQIAKETVTETDLEEPLVCLTETETMSQEEEVQNPEEEKESVKPGKKKKPFSGIMKENSEEVPLMTSGKATTFSDGFKKGFTTLMPIQEGKIHPLAIASFIIGIISLFSYYGAFVLGILAIVFGAIALKKIRNEGYRGSTLAWIGLICGIVSIALTLALISFY